MLLETGRAGLIGAAAVCNQTRNLDVVPGVFALMDGMRSKIRPYAELIGFDRDRSVRATTVLMKR